MRGAALAWLLGALLACGGAAGKKPPSGPAVPGAAVAGVLALLDGGEVDLASLRGRPLVAHFVTTWSLAALEDVEELRAARARVGDGAAFLEIVLEGGDYRVLAGWRDGAEIDWPVALGSDEIARGESGFGAVAAAVPSTVLLDASGRVVWSRYGGLVPGELAAQLGALINAGDE